jgi:mannose-1-phosphate guanylyltransferase/mannose-6-phosphate isomerase
VTSRQQSGKVKDLVTSLKVKNHREADEHLRMYRPWGWYQRIDIGTRFQVKRIMVKPGGRLSLQKHYHRAEHWVVVRGQPRSPSMIAWCYVHENEAVYLLLGASTASPIRAASRLS